MAIFFRDLGMDKIKVSFRSTGDVDVNEFARSLAAVVTPALPGR